jgi:hypothetical protein
MSTTSELVERLKARLERVQHTGARGYHLPVDAKLDRAAAIRLDELERENARLREALKPFGDEWQYWKDDADIAEQGYLIVGNGDGTLSPANIPIAAFQTAAALAGSGEK